jgi:hypothetical protein
VIVDAGGNQGMSELQQDGARPAQQNEPFRVPPLRDYR